MTDDERIGIHWPRGHPRMTDFPKPKPPDDTETMRQEGSTMHLQGPKDDDNKKSAPPPPKPPSR